MRHGVNCAGAAAVAATVTGGDRRWGKSPVAGSAGTTGAVAGAVDLVAYCAGGRRIVRSADHDAAMEQSRTSGAAENAGGSGAGDERHVDPRHAGDCAGYGLLFTAQQHYRPAAIC